jgi:hypothetical protein
MSHLPGNFLLYSISETSRLSKPFFTSLVADLPSHHIVLEIFIILAKYLVRQFQFFKNLILCAVPVLCQFFLTVSNSKMKLFRRISLGWLSRSKRVLLCTVHTLVYFTFILTLCAVNVHVYCIQVNCIQIIMYCVHVRCILVHRLRIR